MKTIYLKNLDEQALISDLQTCFPEWNGIDIELPMCNNCNCHYIGTIPLANGFHANVLVPDDFDENLFTSEKINPLTPVNGFAGNENIIN